MKYQCKKCNKYWDIPVKTCIFCSNPVEEIIEVTPKLIVGVTEVFTPSSMHKKTPYYVYLLNNEDNGFTIKKSEVKYNIGDFFSDSQELTIQYRIGIIGTGTLGKQIAQFLLEKGHELIIKTRSVASIETAKAEILKSLSKKYDSDKIKIFFERIQFVLNYSELNTCDLIIEAATEEISIKKEIFSNLSKCCPDVKIFATNSSSLSIEEISLEVSDPKKVIGIHFFNPVHRMELVELVIGEETSKDSVTYCRSFLSDIGKNVVLVKSSPGYIVNRLLLPQINEAVRIFESGVASMEDIDKAMKLGLNHPMGPFQLADFIGLDICKNILQEMFDKTNNPFFKPTKLLIKLCEEKKFGIKTKEGFYRY